MHCSNLQLYSITSSASKSNLSVTVSPSALAIFVLMTNSNLVGRATGRSAGLARGESYQRILLLAGTYRESLVHRT